MLYECLDSFWSILPLCDDYIDCSTIPAVLVRIAYVEYGFRYERISLHKR